MLNRNNQLAVKKYFNGDDILTQMVADVCDAIFGDDNFVISVGRSIKAGFSVENPAFSIFGDEDKYYIDIDMAQEIIRFNEASKEKIISEIKVYSEKLQQKAEEEERKAITEKLKNVIFVDSEVDIETGHIFDLGAVKDKETKLHTSKPADFKGFAKGSFVVVGHNIVKHDLKYIGDYLEKDIIPIDTLFFSALLFPKKPYHKLIKDDKLRSFEKNNPLADAEKAMHLFYDEINAFTELDEEMRSIYYLLLSDIQGYDGFFKYVDFSSNVNLKETILRRFDGLICENAKIDKMIEECPIELAYALAVISTEDGFSIVPPWILRSFPRTDEIICLLRNIPCTQGCSYCREQLDIKKKLKEHFGYTEFRKYDGRDLQEDAVRAAIQGESLLVVFPTGGGKSLTFQLPALMAGETCRGLTVVISPLQALMKDQVDNLEKKGVMAVAINGLLDPISRKEAIERVENGTAHILYIAPESLRNNTIRRLITKRTIARIVIDEAHCFSSWGQDFRIDYLYIGKFIREIQEEKKLTYNIPVSCFTATAGKKVIKDIGDYFRRELNLEMKTFIASSERKNLEYKIKKFQSGDKYAELRTIIEGNNCPTIVYVFTVKKTYEIADRLTDDGFSAKPFNGQMTPVEKEETQESFIKNEIDIIVATSAFGMGVDKDDVGLVVHYQMPSSIEDYMQESGRAGRKEGSDGNCVAMYSEVDIDSLFYFLNQSKLTIKEIQQIWRAIKKLSKGRAYVCKSVMEIADEAGMSDNNQREIFTAVRTAIGALETAGYVERLNNETRVYATGIIPGEMENAVARLKEIKDISEEQRQLTTLIIQNLIGSRSRAKAGNTDSSKRTDELADILGVEHSKIIDAVTILKENGLLTDENDLKAYIYADDNKNKAYSTMQKYTSIEEYIISYLSWEDETVNFKELNEAARSDGKDNLTPQLIKTILYYWGTKGYVKLSKQSSQKMIEISYLESKEKIKDMFNKRRDVCGFIVKYLFEKAEKGTDKDRQYVEFSLMELKREYENQLIIHEGELKVTANELQNALIYLQRIKALDVEGGFFVLYQPLKIKRIEMNNRKHYTLEDYSGLQKHYAQKVRQIHMIDEYSKLMQNDPQKAREFVKDYFELDIDEFDRKYFSEERRKVLNKSINPRKYEDLFGKLSAVQKEIINDDTSQYITVAAGPGSGKTMVLVHKLASLILLEDVKCEQLLMLTFSRPAATEFKERLIKLIGKAAYGVEIKTFHSYCFDILGRKGDASELNNIVEEAVQLIRAGDVECERIKKAVLVVDEAQDIGPAESEFIDALIEQNEDMRVVMVGDDDQNVLEFRKSSAGYMREFTEKNDAKVYSMIDNYRSCKEIVGFANEYAKLIPDRMKDVPVKAVSDEEGNVTIVHFASENMEEPLAERIKTSDKSGTSCVLTWKNDDTLKIVGTLTEKGMNAKLIQDRGQVKLKDLVEIADFFDFVSAGCETPTIPEELWQEAKEEICTKYRTSSTLSIYKEVVSSFEDVNDVKYKTDFEDFIIESKVEDYMKGGRRDIVVSTIHKSKGREFDNVYIVFKNCYINSPEELRVNYVGMTRAKNNLEILCNNDLMNGMLEHCNDVLEDNNNYGAPKKAQVHLTHNDVYLDYFINKQNYIKNIRSGDGLDFDGMDFFIQAERNDFPVARLSEEGRKRMNNIMLERENMKIRAEVGMVVRWRKPETAKKYTIILPSLYIE